jgi:hypothetical protein
MKQHIYKYRDPKNKQNGSLRLLKDGVDFDEYLSLQKEKGFFVVKVKRPSQRVIMCMIDDGITCAVDGCGGIELDGICEHGFPSILVALGMV